MTTNFVDDRAKQDSLIKDPNVANRPDPEPQIDRASSEKFADDRQKLEENDAGEQSALTAETVDDGNQRDLTGDIAGETPGWSE